MASNLTDEQMNDLVAKGVRMHMLEEAISRRYAEAVLLADSKEFAPLRRGAALALKHLAKEFNISLSEPAHG